MKKSILFVVDKPNWAYEFMVMSWLPYILNDYDCFVIYQSDYKIVRAKYSNIIYRTLFNYFSKFKNIFKESGLKLIHSDGYYYTKNSKNIIHKYVSKDGEKIVETNNITHFDVMIEMAYYLQYISYYPFSSTKKIVGIFTDTFPHEGASFDIKNNLDKSSLDRNQFYKKYLNHYDHIFVGGGNLYNDYKKITDKVSFVYGIYGEENFEENVNIGNNDYLTIGWTGNPTREMKGFREFIEPAVKKVRDTGRKINLKTKFSGSYEELYSFYKDVDLVIIASSADSGPSLYAEACLSSVPVVSTKIGLPLLGIEDGVNGYFINRSVDDIVEKIIHLYDNRKILKKFSERVKGDYLNKLGNNITVKNVLNNI